jgi:ABC-type multidrug transport system ATPase subunit
MNAITPPDFLPATRQSVPAPSAGGVSIRRLTRRFGSNTVLDALDLDLAAGSFTALLGRSGSGKTTLLRTLEAGVAQRHTGAGRARCARAR